MVFCTKCGFEIIEESDKFCTKCGATIIQNSELKESKVNLRPDNPSTTNTSERSSWWYVPPIIFGIFGGIISYLILRKTSPKLAKQCLIIGVIMFGVLLFFNGDGLTKIGLSSVLDPSGAHDFQIAKQNACGNGEGFSDLNGNHCCMSGTAIRGGSMMCVSDFITP
jgi:hypothetical protein